MIAVGLAGAQARAGPAAQAGGGEVALERAGGHDAAGPATSGGLGGLDRAGAFEAAERRVQRAERDSPERTERLGQALLQLVAVKWLLGEQSENGELEHEGTPERGTDRGSAMY